MILPPSIANSFAKVVHGLSVPIGKAGYNLPRTISSVISTSIDDPEPVPISNIRHTHSTATPLSDSSFRTRKRGARSMTPNPPLFHIGRSVIQAPTDEQQPGAGQIDEPERPVNLVAQDSPVLSSEERETDARAV